MVTPGFPTATARGCNKLQPMLRHGMLHHGILRCARTHSALVAIVTTRECYMPPLSPCEQGLGCSAKTGAGPTRSPAIYIYTPNFDDE